MRGSTGKRGSHGIRGSTGIWGLLGMRGSTGTGRLTGTGGCTGITGGSADPPLGSVVTVWVTGDRSEIEPIDRPSTDPGGRELGRPFLFLFFSAPCLDATESRPALEVLGAMGPSWPLGAAFSGYLDGLGGNGKGTRSEIEWSCGGRDCRIRLRLAFCLPCCKVAADLLPKLLISDVCDREEVDILDFRLRGFRGR